MLSLFINKLYSRVRMKVYKNVISPDLIQSCVDELKSKLKINCWTSSQQTWSDEILINVFGSTLSTKVSFQLINKLQKELESKLPNADKVMYQFYVWQKNSGISIHSDGSYKWGATIYLNEAWHLNYGGIFLWIDHNKKLHAEMPEYNQMILNDDSYDHMVTPIGIDNPIDRYTIQIWGS